jgi:hypothetical protein
VLLAFTGDSHGVLAAVCNESLQHIKCSWVLALAQTEGHIMTKEVRLVLQGYRQQHPARESGRRQVVID